MEEDPNTGENVGRRRRQGKEEENKDKQE